jgi:hypothetical protein
MNRLKKIFLILKKNQELNIRCLRKKDNKFYLTEVIKKKMEVKKRVLKKELSKAKKDQK